MEHERSILGLSVYSESQFNFYPENPVSGKFQSKRNAGSAILQSDGTFTFIQRKPRKRETRCLLKLPHGRLSLTKDGSIRLTLNFTSNELSNDVKVNMYSECMQAVNQLYKLL